LPFIRGATRREIYRRIAVATDFIHTNYAQDVDLDALANVACLSKYHFLRLFTLVHGVTPYVFLQNKRTSVAARLLRTTQLTMSQVASCVGFARRSTVVRRIRSRTGFTPLQLRAQGEDAIAVARCRGIWSRPGARGPNGAAHSVVAAGARRR
jgi:AraC family transcriptional regulator